jgi:threonine dehydratase
VSDTKLVTLDAVYDAANRLADVLRPTPAVEIAGLSALAGREVWCKPENYQRTGSFKIRGAYNRISRLPAGTRVVAASAGNHAQGVALAARLAGLHADVFMPATASLPKLDAARAYGATVRLVSGGVDDCIAEALSAAESTDAVFVPPFDDADVIAGQGTIGLELAAELPERVRTVVVPVGGGGLIAGIARALAMVRPGVSVVGVQAAGAASMRASLDAGHPVVLDDVVTVADGIAMKSPSALTLAHVRACVTDVVTVTDEDIARAVVALLERAKSVVEPAGAVAFAAVLAGVGIDEAGPVGVVLSGGNVDPLLLAKLVDHGLAAAGRFLALRVLLPDSPGSLARLTEHLAAAGVNIIDVEHHRSSGRLPVNTVEVVVHVETRNHAHQAELVSQLRSSGFDVR